jgi:hypothetical protein
MERSPIRAALITDPVRSAKAERIHRGAHEPNCEFELDRNPYACRDKAMKTAHPAVVMPRFSVSGG